MVKTKFTRTDTLFALKYIISVFLMFILGFLLLRFPETAGQGISDGIDLCLGTLIPSLLPFMIVSSLAVNLNTFELIENIFSKATNILFRLPGKSLGIILMSMVGGYPIGSKMIKDLYERGEITAMQGKRLLLFCINPGPAFAISSVGFYMLGSKKAGIIIYLSVILSSFLICFASRFLENKSTYVCKAASHKSTVSFANEFVRSVSSGSKSMLIVCAWVIIFSGIGRLVDIISFSPDMNMFLNCLLEVTNGCYLAGGTLSIPAIACIIGFGGICTHFQVMDAVRTVKLRYKYFIIARIIHGALSAVICNLILKIYPVSYDVFSFGTLPTTRVTPVSVALSVSMLTMCALVMLGDTFYIKVRRKSKQTVPK